MSRRPAAVAVTVCAVALGACADGLQFRRDERVRFLAPPDRSTVSGPVQLRWTARGDVRGSRFGVFVDGIPMRPGKDLRALAEGNLLCRPSVGCPDRRWLADRGVHVTRRTTLRLPPLPPDRGEDLGDVRRHEITVVLLDRAGTRQGEAAWTLTLFTAAEER